MRKKSVSLHRSLAPLASLTKAYPFLEEEPTKKVRHVKRKKKALSRYQEEAEMKSIEQNSLKEDINSIASNDGFERFILRNPNSSFLWIRYVAFRMENEDILASRITMERALRVINFQNEKEKLNLWLAFINLEYAFGEEETLIK